MTAAHRLYETLGFTRQAPLDWEFEPGEWLWSYVLTFGMGSEPTVPIPAATVVLLRSGRRGFEVLLTRRPTTMAFAADMHVFPGGRVDAADADAGLRSRSVVTATRAARALGGDLTPETALATYVAAIRELFEEAGLLLADAGEDGTTPPAASLSQARSALVGGDADFGTIVAELGLRLRTDWLMPLSRWVTPATFPRRFDARFFAAELPAGGRVTFEGDEVAGYDWLTPRGALEAMSAGRIGLWVPTSATLQQLEHVTAIDQIRDRLAPGPLADVEVDQITSDVTRIVMPAGGGVAGQPVCAYLVGRRRHVIVDPGDPTGPALERAVTIARSRGGTIEAVALTQADPDHAGGSEALAVMLDIPVIAGAGAGRALPYEVREVADGTTLAFGDVPLRALATPGPNPEHVAWLVGEGADVALSGDLDGRRGARALPGPWDEAAAATSRERLASAAPGTVWLPGHPAT